MTMSFTPPYPHYTRIWPEPSAIASSWTEQRLDAFTTCKGDDDNNDDDLLVQGTNGPCGVLAVVQAELWLQQQESQNDNTTTSLSLNDKLTRALKAILQRVVQYSSSNNNNVYLADGTTVAVADAARVIRTAAALVEAVALTTFQAPTTSIENNNHHPHPHGSATTPTSSSSSLVEGPHWLCSVELMCLLLRGTIGRGHVRAWDETTQQKMSFYHDKDNNKIGFLSYSELEEGMAVADDLKFDKQVWVVHTGDHFVTVRRRKAKPEANDKSLRVEIYDGLPPAGPRRAIYELSGDLARATPAAPKYVETFVKKRPGQADDIVQAKKTDSSSYKDWMFEVVPAIEDPTVQGPLDEDPNEPVYTFDASTKDDGPWRCASCYYTRFQTMQFGLNTGGTVCAACQKPRHEAMWSLWQTYHELSPRMKRRARRMYAPKLELVLSTLWPQAVVTEVTDNATQEKTGSD